MLAALAIRAVCAARVAVMFNDGPLFLALARSFGAGDWAAGLAHDYHPLYPLLVATVQPLVGSWELAAVAVSVVAGGAAVAFLYVLLRSAFDASVAGAGAALLAVHPHAIEFSCDVQSEGLYLALFLAAAAVLWGALTRASARRAALAGSLAGLAYLTRPEGLSVLVVGGMLAGLQLVRRRWRLATTLRWCAALGLGAALLVTPYVLSLHATSGEWVLTQKKSALAMAEAATDIDSGNVEVVRSEAADARPASGLFVVGHRLGELLRTAVSAARPEILVLLAFGLFVARGRPGLRAQFVLAFALVLSAVLYALLASAGYVSRRHVLPPLVLGFGYAALGLPALGALLLALPRRLAPRSRLARSGAALTAALGLVAALGLGKAARATRSDELAERRAAEWLRVEIGDGAPVAAARQRIAYYAGGPFVSLRGAPAEGLVGYLESRGVRYVIVDDDELEEYPELERLAHGHLELLRREQAAGHSAQVLALPTAAGRGAGR